MNLHPVALHILFLLSPSCQIPLNILAQRGGKVRFGRCQIIVAMKCIKITLFVSMIIRYKQGTWNEALYLTNGSIVVTRNMLESSLIYFMPLLLQCHTTQVCVSQKARHKPLLSSWIFLKFKNNLLSLFRLVTWYDFYQKRMNTKSRRVIFRYGWWYWLNKYIRLYLIWLGFICGQIENKR